MRALKDEEAHVLLLKDVDLIPEEKDMAEKLVDRGYLTFSIEKEDGHDVVYYDITTIGSLALQCYLSLKLSQSILK